jgi:hypothetical protein
MSGIDGYDWSIFGGNPVPGDPDAVRAIAARFADLADTVAQQNGLVRQVGSDAEAIWVGPAADKFRPHLGKLPGQLDKLVTSYRDAADALNGFWPKLAAAQQLAVTALSKAMAAKAAIASANAQVAGATANANSAAAAYNSASASLAAATKPSASMTQQVQSLQSGYQAAQSQLGAANAALGAANAEMAAAHQMKDNAVSQAHAASAVAAVALHAASAAGIQNPHPSWLSGIFDDIGSAFSSAWHWATHQLKEAEPFLQGISEVLGVATAVLAVASLALAPFGVGEVLELANEGLMALKTGDDALLVAAGDPEAETLLAEDGAAMLTGGLGRLASDSSEVMVASGEATEALSKVGEAEDTLSAAGERVTNLEGVMASASTRAEQAQESATIMRSMQSDAAAEGNVVNATGLGQRAAEADDQAASAQNTYSAAFVQHNVALEEQRAAQQALTEAQGTSSEAQAALTRAEQYSPGSPGGFARSASGLNNLSRTKAMFNDSSDYFANFRTDNGLSGSPAQQFVQYYTRTVTGSPGIGRLGAAAKTFSVGLNVNDAVDGVSKVPAEVHAVAAGGPGAG